MDLNLKAQRVSVVVHTVFGFLAGYLSLYFSRFWYALGASLVLLIILGFITQKTFGKKRAGTSEASVQQRFDRKWWLGNGVAIYLLIWLMAWILLFNLVPLPQKII
ncbi:MAG: DUF5379 family protein [Candidatus Aenigmarchaeota archaeon]|nr:DUF5379 family protein [Candidatus Aenigmarchaeota archaeon]